MSKIQYTIRKIPASVDKALRKRAKQQNKSFNTTVVEALNQQVFGTNEVPVHPDFSWFVGAGKDLLGPEFDSAIDEQSKIDPKIWK